MGYLSTNGKTDAGSVVVEEAVDTNDDDQKWERSSDDGSGYFTLKNPTSGLFLTGHNPPKNLTIEGTASFFVYEIVLLPCFLTYL